MCYFTCQAQKLPFLAVLTCFPILGKILDGGQDGDHCLWHHRPPAGPPPIKYTSSFWDYQRLSTEGKIVSEYCNIPKTLGKGSINPSLLYHGGGMNLRVRPRVKSVLDSVVSQLVFARFQRYFQPLWHSHRFFLWPCKQRNQLLCISFLRSRFPKRILE